jgi:phage tail-like protein
MSDTTSHYLMSGIAGWQEAAATNVAFSANGAVLSLQPLPGSIRPLVDAAGSFGGFESAIGVAVDCEDDVFILDAGSCAIKRFDRCAQKFVKLHCVGGRGSEPRMLKNPHGLAISSCNDLYVADTGNHRVQIFSLRDLTLRAIWSPLQVSESTEGYSVTPAMPSAIPPSSNCEGGLTYLSGTWQPWDIVVSKDNCVCVSDYANGLIHFFDASGCWRSASNGSGPGQPPLSKPTRIAMDTSGRLYVIQESMNFVVILDRDGKFLGTIEQPEDLMGRFCPVAVGVDINGNICLSDCLTRKVYFYQPVGDGNWCPCRCCGSASAFATSIVFDRSGAPLLVDGAQTACQLDPAAAYPATGSYIAGPLDSRTYRCIWHRVVLSGSVPRGSAIKVDTFTSESPKSTDEVLSLPDSRWSTGQVDSTSGCGDWDCLIQSSAGRYLWLRLTLTGDGAETPALDKIRVFYPRASSLQYLPAVYRQDSISADFLDRFLSIFDTLRDDISDRVSFIARYFDPMATPANPRNVGGTDFLSYLASWLGMSLQSNWSVHRRRELVRQAHRLYALRGTPAGLRLAIELYAGVRPSILEMFRLRRWLIVNQSALGDCSSVFGSDVMQRLQIGTNSSVGNFRLIDYGDPNLDLFNEYANQFLVIVPRWPGAGDSDFQSLQQIVEMTKPAHTLAEIRWAEPRLRVGIQAFVGVDTVLGKYPIGVIEGQGTLGYDTVLGVPGEQNKRPSLQVGRNATVGSTTVLN